MNLKALLSIISPPRRVLTLCLVLLLFSSGLNLLNPLIAGELTSILLNHKESFFSGLPQLVMAWVVLLIARSIFSFLSSYLTGSAAETVLARLRSRLYEHSQLLPMGYYDNRKKGDVLSIMTSDSALISNFVTGTLIQILPLTLTLVGAGIMMVWLNPMMAALTLAFLPFFAITMRLVARRIRPLSRQWVDAYGDMMAVMEENLSMLPAIKSFTRETGEIKRFGTKNDFLLNLSKRQLFIHSLLPPVISFLAGAGLLTLISVGNNAIQQGEMQPGELVTLLFYATLLIQPLNQMAGVYGQYQRTRGASERILDFLAQQREPQSHGLPDLTDVEGDIQFHNVSFAYKSAPEAVVLKQLNLRLHAGETVALVGENGAGKTTLAHLLMRLIDPTEGEILIDGQATRDYSITSVRAQIGLVAQHTLLLNGSVAENIGWGKAFASPEEIESAAKAARAHDFITALPNGYNTIIGDQGLKLSGGQRQRLSLARALLKDPPILILDEATSMFDPTAESDFLRDCRAFLENRTVILITHRPASLAVADRVLLLQNGQLTEVQDTYHYLKTGLAE